MDAALIPLCQQGIRIMNYMDDWLICAPTKQQAWSNTKDVLLHLLRLGLMLNKEKSCLTLCRTVLYLGLVLDSMTMKDCLNPQRILMLREHISYLISDIGEVWPDTPQSDGSSLSGCAARFTSYAAVTAVVHEEQS